MNIKVAAFTVSEKSSNTYLLKIIKIMSILKSIRSDSLVVSSQFEKRSPKPGSNLWVGDIFMTVQCMHSF